MPPAFAPEEYAARLERVRRRMVAAELDALVIGDPANMNWLTGFDAWSFYVPQILVVGLAEEPLWLGRAMDTGAVRLTTYLDPGRIRSYPEHCVQHGESHPMDYMAAELAAAGFERRRIGYESDRYHFSPKALARLEAGLPNARFVDANLLVNWARAVKSEAELALMRQAARLAELAMRAACDAIEPGVRQCDLAARIMAAQIKGTDEFGGDLTSLPPMILAGTAASTAHPMWSDEAFEPAQTVALELGGARKRYHAGLARTVQLGPPPRRLLDTAGAVEDGMAAALETVRAGVTGAEVHGAWQAVLDRHGLIKESRIGYAIGVGYPPDWGEHTLSLRAGETAPIEADVTLHVILGMWFDDWGMELSETIRVTDAGYECLTDFPRAVHRVA